MTTFAAPRRDGTSRPAVASVAVPRASLRESIGVLGLLLGMFGILLALALTVGAPLPIGQ